MLLVITGSADATADYLLQRLSTAGHRFARLDTDRVTTEVRIEVTHAGSTLLLGQQVLSPEDITDIWYRRPEPIRVEGEQDEDAVHAALEWSEALEGWLAQIPTERWMNHPALNALASHKVEQLHRARYLGLTVPDTLVTQSGDTLRTFWHKHRGRLIVKPLAGGFIERAHRPDSNIYTSVVRQEDLAEDADLALVPTLFQERIDKMTDVRLCVVDGSVSAVALKGSEESGSQRLDIRRDNMRDVAYSRVELPHTVRAQVLSLTRAYRLRFAAVDMAIDAANRWVFFELNPNGQWAWLDIAGGQSIWTLFSNAFSRSR
jgi:glutathione synthase/RimK-type ligase-like ATP-grasp enzyme